MKYLIANLKMFIGKDETIDYAKKLVTIVKPLNKVMVCPSLVFIDELAKIFDGKIEVGAQNCSAEESGAYTGQVSASQIKSEGASFVILGHSETRAFETPQTINKKIKIALKNKLKCVVCLLETKENKLVSELKILLDGVDDLTNVLLAYEPEWAIGSGKCLSPKNAELAIKTIKNAVKTLKNQEIAAIYGGGVNVENAKDYLSKDIDGLLIGNASRQVENFAKMCNEIYN